MTTRNLAIHAATVAVWLAAAAVTVPAQSSLAALGGKVTDDQGGVLPGVTVTIRQLDTNVTRAGVTETNGQYYLPSLPAGRYELTLELSGFTKATRQIVLRVGQDATLDVILKVGGVEESVLVSGVSALVETRATVGSLIDRREIDNLPTIGRDFADLAKLAPGVSSTGQSSMGFSAAGQRQFQNNVIVDGATNAMQFYGTQSESYPQDWVQEFQVMTNGFCRRVRTGDRCRAERHHAQRHQHGAGARLRVLPGRRVRHRALRRPLRQRRAASSSASRRTSISDGSAGSSARRSPRTACSSSAATRTSTTTRRPCWRSPTTGAIAARPSVIPSRNTTRAMLLKGDWNANDRNRVSLRHSRTSKEDQNCSGQGGDGCNSSPLWTLEKRATFNGPIWSVLGTWTSTLSGSAFNEMRAYYGVNKIRITSNLAGTYRHRPPAAERLDGAIHRADLSRRLVRVVHDRRARGRDEPLLQRLASSPSRASTSSRSADSSRASTS